MLISNLKKLAIITTHPIQYQIPLFKKLKKFNIKPVVFFASKHGYKSELDHEFSQKIKWNVNSNILSGYKKFFSKNQKYKINDIRLSFKGLEKLLLKENIHYVLVLGWNNFHYLKSIFLSLKNKIKIILRVETNLFSTKNNIKRFLKKLIFKYFFSLFSNFLYIGKLNKKFYLYHGVSKKKLLPAPYFVDNEFFNLRTSKIKIKKKLNINSKKVVLFVGKLILRKNPLEFIKLAELYKKNKDIKFLMIGSGELENECKKYLKKNNLKNVTLLGFVNQKKIREYYWVSDLLIVPSHYETWGLNINEAFASHTVVICSENCGAAEDLIDEGHTGFKYKVGDLKMLKKKVDYILSNPVKLKKIISKIKKKIKNYNIDQTLISISKVLNES